MASARASIWACWVGYLGIISFSLKSAYSSYQIYRPFWAAAAAILPPHPTLFFANIALSHSDYSGYIRHCKLVLWQKLFTKAFRWFIMRHNRFSISCKWFNIGLKRFNIRYKLFVIKDNRYHIEYKSFIISNKILRISLKWFAICHSEQLISHFKPAFLAQNSV